MHSGLSSRVRLGVIPAGTGNNLVRSFGLDRESATALRIIRQGHTIPLDVAWINRQSYGVNASVGLFPYLVARRVTRSLAGWVYEMLRHLRFTPWPLRLRYTDATGHAVTLPTRRYIVGTLLNTSYYGSLLHMAPDAVGDDGLFDVTLIHATPKLAYPLVLLMLWTGQYALSRHTTTFRARRVDVWPEAPCHCETDGEMVPHASRYTVEMAGQLRVLVPSWHASSRLAA
jgi:diacylglycerol kinase family enzyme